MDVRLFSVFFFVRVEHKADSTVASDDDRNDRNDRNDQENRRIPPTNAVRVSSPRDISHSGYTLRFLCISFWTWNILEGRYSGPFPRGTVLYHSKHSQTDVLPYLAMFRLKEKKKKKYVFDIEDIICQVNPSLFMRNYLLIFNFQLIVEEIQNCETQHCFVYVFVCLVFFIDLLE